ncbi:hypothetical protein ADEAN_000557600 [Angomonas deanei]|uniref:Uncharacterized protein n=1 Tax=Angomonas deanei TaxID=59799 RepID=A0A7G2CE16_9TRYP|nr:hypothetical protein ADEAN_000557600 [Angomonas deanei]
MAALTPLEDYGPLYDYPRAPLIKTKPYLLWMDVLAPTSVHREWWLEELQALGAVLSNTSDVLLLDHRADPSEEDEADSVPDAPSVPIARPPPSERYWERTVTAAPTAVTAPTVNRIEFVPPCIVPGATGVEGRPVGSPQRPILPIQEEFESSSESYSDAVNASPARLSSPVTDTATSNPAHSSKPSSVRAVGTIPFSATSETSPSTPTPLRRKSSNIYSSTAGSESMRQPQSLPPSNVLFCNDALEERDVRSSAVATIVHDDSAVLAEDFDHFRDAAETTSPPTSTPRPSRRPLSAREIALEAVQAYKASRHRSDSDDEEAQWPSESSSDTVMPARSETNNDGHAWDNNNPQNTSTSSVSNYVISRLQNSQDHTATRNLSALLRDSSASRPREGPQTPYGREDTNVNAEVSRLRQRIRQTGPWGV